MSGVSSDRGRVLVVEDDPRLASHIAGLLEEHGFRAIAVTTGPEALRAAKQNRPHLVVLDVNLPGLSGYEVCRKLRETYGETLPIMFLSGERTESFDRVAGLLVGGDDYLVKPFAEDELVARARVLTRRSVKVPGPLADRPLTRREAQVLELLAGGLKQTEIADRLVISPKTVGTHIEHVLAKLGVHSRAQAVALAYREQLITIHA